MATNFRFLGKFSVIRGSTTLQLTDIFSDAFDIYRIVLSDFRVDTATDYFYTRLINSSDTVISTANYDTTSSLFLSNANFQQLRAVDYTRIVPSTTLVDDDSFTSFNAIYNFYQPFDSSAYTFFTSEVTQWLNGTGRGARTSGVQQTQQSITGIQLAVGALNHVFEGGNATVYGIK
tara:strand:+ start:37 stop:564 length:528 start_codon:yes stop_codon:yes gene_type:complete